MEQRRKGSRVSAEFLVLRNTEKNCAMEGFFVGALVG